MIAKTFLSIVGASLILTGCQTTTLDDASLDQVRSNPKLMSKHRQKCMGTMNFENVNHIESISELLLSSPEKLSTDLCTRVYAAIASGKLTAQDINDAKSGNFSPKFVRVLQGR